MKLRLIIILLSLLTFSGCQTVVRSTITTFHSEDHLLKRGTISVIAAEKKVNDSLEFRSYKTKVERLLVSNGYKLSINSNNAEYIAIISYGIGNGVSSVVSTPIFGQTGGGTTYSSGTVSGVGGSARYSGSSYTMPTYGVVGSSSSTVTNYTRAVALDIIDAEKMRAGEVKKIYELRAKSKGSCSVIAGVFEEILIAMFFEFPKKNGQTQLVDVGRIPGQIC